MLPSKVENHIAKYGHLPNVPSENEVNTNGVDIGEMQVKLLQEIEELTLYVKEQQKELARLREENKEIKKILISSE